MRILVLAATVAATFAIPATAASAQSWRGHGYGYNPPRGSEYREELRECRRELRRADSRREYRKERRECRRELREAMREDRREWRERRRDWRDDRRWRGPRYGYRYPDRDRGRYYWDGYRWRSRW